MRRFPGLFFIFSAIAVGVLIGGLAPGVTQALQKAAASLGWSGPADRQTQQAPRGSEVPANVEGQAGPDPAASMKADPEGQLKLTTEQIEGAAIETAPVTGGELAHHLTAPGVIAPSADRIGRVGVKLVGMVAELRKNLGDFVAKDEVVAVLESREVGDAKSEYLAARLNNDLQQTLFERDRKLWEKRISTEQVFLRSQAAAEVTRIKLELAREKLFILGLTEKEIAALPDQPTATLTHEEIRSPIAGRVVERKVDVGSMLGRDNLETELFVIVDLSEVWIDIAVTPGDLPLIKEGQRVSISANGVAEKARGKIIFISPLLDKDTRTARVVAKIPNPDGVWRPGIFVTAEVTTDEQPALLLAPLSAVQMIGGVPVVFVRTPEGFERRKIMLGRKNSHAVEVLSGLQNGEVIAVRNTFKLKAEMGKSQAED
ncbi:efflux transporter periplasmic adaptor subunit [Beijerinckiaceae bacterium]|nr:efflux transporter periplasmic adaptor subunit [Beijerinckiaceae bacterium]